MRTETAPELWPFYEQPTDLAAIESLPLESRGLPPTTYDLLVRAAGLWPDLPAVTVLADAEHWTDAVPVTFATLCARVRRIANLMSQHGVRRGDAVGLLSANTESLLTAVLAAQAAGIAAPVNPALSEEHTERLLRLSGARVLVAAGPELDQEVWDKARRIAEALGLRALFALRPTDAERPAPALDQLPGVHVAHLEVDAAAYPSDRLVGIQLPTSDDLAAYFHTGGTTGSPKLAAHTHRNEVSDAWAISAGSPLGEHAAVFAALPLFHVNALMVTVLGPLLRGQHVVWAGPLGYREPALYGVIWKLFAHHRIAAMSAVPTVYAVLAQIPVDADISALQLAAVGASALPPSVREAFEDSTGVSLCEGYGLTEATCASARSFFGDGYRHGSVGQRLPYQQVKAVRIDGDTWHDAPPGETGVLAVTGPTVFAGYVTGQSTAGPVLDPLGTVHDGWLNTGDLGWVDADGFVYLTGRAKDLIIRGGHNIDPATIENALLAHPQVTGAAAIGRPDPHAGEVPVAYVTLMPDATVTDEDLLAWAADHVPERAATPKEIAVIPALPVTDVGKPHKVPLRRDTTRRAIAADLIAVGYECDPSNIDCDIDNGQVSIVLPRPEELALRAKVAATLDQYALRWDFAEDVGR